MSSVVDLLAALKADSRDAGDRLTFEVCDPATTMVIAHVVDHTPADAAAAVESAAQAFAGWAATGPRARAEVLRRAYELMNAEIEGLAKLITTENGKSDEDARAEVAYAADFFRWFSEEAVRTDGAYGVSPGGGSRAIVTHKPVGVAALVTPWNFPAAMVARKVAPALAAGCTVVLKPAPETPLTAMALADLLERAGVPEGVVNVVPTTAAAEVVTAWLEDARIRKLSFTGSTPVGRTLLRQASDRVLNASMELGGNAPFIVCADADIEAAVAGAMVAKFRNAGQACTAANRFFVHDDVLEEFVARIGAAVETLTCAPLINARAVAGVTAIVNETVASGARMTHQGPVGAEGWYYPATVLVDVRPDMRIAQQEIFGPVVSIMSWSCVAELLAMANDTEFGLAGYVYGGLATALAIAESLDVGMVGVNRGVVSDPSAPFGGVKQSGLGREGAREGLREFQEVQFLSIDWPSASPDVGRLRSST
jgi:succinate-semialdehyde dehydrogenase/glutarate-semialdehyde dehydrogenase